MTRSGMKREALAWSAAVAILIALWLAIPLALLAFDPLPPDMSPGEFLGLGPPWFYLALSVDVVATASFLIAVVIRIAMLVIGVVRERSVRFSNRPTD